MYGRRSQRKRGLRRAVVTLLALVLLVSVCFPGLRASAEGDETTSQTTQESTAATDYVKAENTGAAETDENSAADGSASEPETEDASEDTAEEDSVDAVDDSAEDVVDDETSGAAAASDDANNGIMTLEAGAAAVADDAFDASDYTTSVSIELSTNQQGTTSGSATVDSISASSNNRYPISYTVYNTDGEDITNSSGVSVSANRKLTVSATAVGTYYVKVTYYTNSDNNWTGPFTNYLTVNVTGKTIYVWYDRVTAGNNNKLTAYNDSTGIASVILNNNNVPHGNGGNASNTNGLAIENAYSTSGQTVSITVTPAAGYYVTFISVNCCGSGAAVNCETYEAGGAFTEDFTVSTSGAVTVSVELDATNGFHHNSNASNYFILICVAPIPTPLYVEYDYGNILTYIGSGNTSAFSTANGWTTDNGSNNYGTGGVETENTQYRYAYTDTGTDAGNAAEAAKWTHYANTITDAAKEQAAAAGYYFVGWKAEYYTSVDVESQTADANGDRPDYNNYNYTFNDPYGTEYYSESDQVALTTNVRLIAEWEPIELDVTKVVESLPANTTGSYTITVQKDDTDFITLTVNANVDETYTKTYSCTSNNTAITPGVYTIVETNNGGALTGTNGTYYPSVSYTTGTVTIPKNGGTGSYELVVTNTYTSAQPAIKLVKVWLDANGSEFSDTSAFDAITLSVFSTGTNIGSVTLKAGNGWTGYITDLNGASTSGLVVTESGVPTGYLSTVVEESGTVSYTDDDGNNYVCTVYTVTNQLTYTTITLEKYVEGNMGDYSKEFAFTIDAGDDTPTTATVNDDTVSVTDGSISLSHKGTATFTVPIGTTVTITETSGDYSVSAEVTNGSDTDTADNVVTFTASADGNTVTFTNTKEAEIDTAVTLDSAPYIFLTVLALGGTVLLMKRRRVI